MMGKNLYFTARGYTAFYDLESFNVVSTTTRESSPVRDIVFGADGSTLYAGMHDSLKVCMCMCVCVCVLCVCVCMSVCMQLLCGV